MENTPRDEFSDFESDDEEDDRKLLTPTLPKIKSRVLEDDDSFKSIDSNILRAKNEALSHNIPEMLKIVESFSRQKFPLDFKLGMEDWNLLWRTAQASMGGGGVGDGTIAALDTNSVSTLNVSLEGISPGKYTIEEFPTNERSVQNLETELASFAKSFRPSSSPEKLFPAIYRNFDPAHPLAVNLVQLGDTNINHVSRSKRHEKAKGIRDAVFKEALRSQDLDR